MECFLKLAVLLAVTVGADARARIIGGSTVPITDFPWQASLKVGDSHICGASFIDNSWLVTAAHCVDGQTASSLVIGHGNADKTAHNKATVKRYIKHPNYVAAGNQGYPNDIALIELASPVTFDSRTNKIALPQSSNALTNCWITGWGCTSTILSFCLSSPNNLMGTSITKIDLDACKGLWSDTQIQEKHVCVHESSKSACNGDSGGPLTCYQDGIKVLAGATSWGASGCLDSKPSVYTRISEYTGWIKDTAGI